jgi:hypothetical protein
MSARSDRPLSLAVHGDDLARAVAALTAAGLLVSSAEWSRSATGCAVRGEVRSARVR